MRYSRGFAVLAGVVLAATLVPAAALARSNDGDSCGSDTNGYVRVDMEGWWQHVADSAFGGDEALLIATFAPLMGVPPEDVKATYLAGVLAWDKNGNGRVCWKDPKDTPGTPAYVFTLKDDSSSKP